MLLQECRCLSIQSWCDRFSDEDIDRARRPKKYSIHYLQWPAGAWQKWSFHAYHIKQIAKKMKKTLSWIGPPIVLYNESIDGNHRLRALRYNYQKFGVVIKNIPDFIDKRNLSGKTQ